MGEGVRKEIMRYGDLLAQDDSVSPIYSARIIILWLYSGDANSFLRKINFERSHKYVQKAVAYDDKTRQLRIIRICEKCVDSRGKTRMGMLSSGTFVNANFTYPWKTWIIT